MFTHIGRGGRTGMYIRVGAYYIHTTHAAVHNIGIRVEFHERFKIGTRKPNKNNNILLYTAAENIIILYRVIETGRKKKTTPNCEVVAAAEEEGTRRISRRDQRMPLGGRYTIYTHIIILTHSTRTHDDVITYIHVCVYIVAPRRKIKE